MIELVVEGKPRDVGTITVARVLPNARRRLVGPFAFLDHMGPVTIPPGVGFDVLPHPHIGLSTVTYFLAGTNVHRDSLGTIQVNRPGDINLMTAGAGVVHSERAEPAFRERGGLMHGIQMWLALPEAHEDDVPSFAHHPMMSLPEIAPAPGVRGRVLAGRAFGVASPLVHPSAPLLVDLVLEPGASLELGDDAPERAVFVIEGTVTVGETTVGETTLATNQLAVLTPGAAVPLVAQAACRLLVVGGPPMGPRFMEWNFVASSRERIDRARAAWQAQTFPRIPGDDVEYVPWPAPTRPFT